MDVVTFGPENKPSENNIWLFNRRGHKKWWKVERCCERKKHSHLLILDDTKEGQNNKMANTSCGPPEGKKVRIYISVVHP